MHAKGSDSIKAVLNLEHVHPGDLTDVTKDLGMKSGFNDGMFACLTPL